MAKDQKPEDAMAQAHQAIDTYFDFIKKSVSSFPTGGTELGEKLKSKCSERHCCARSRKEVESGEGF
jgi:hypothetical protein